MEASKISKRLQIALDVVAQVSLPTDEMTFEEMEEVIKKIDLLISKAQREQRSK